MKNSLSDLNNHLFAQEEIKLCPKGTRPYEQTRRIGQFYRNLIFKCNCGCLRVEKSFFEGGEAKSKARAAAIQEWNEKVGGSDEQ